MRLNKMSGHYYKIWTKTSNTRYEKESKSIFIKYHKRGSWRVIYNEFNGRETLAKDLTKKNAMKVMKLFIKSST